MTDDYVYEFRFFKEAVFFTISVFSLKIAENGFLQTKFSPKFLD